MKIRNKKIIAIITILVITIIYGIWKENRGKIKIENINEQAEITDIEDNEKTKNLHNTTVENNENIKNKETNKTNKTDKTDKTDKNKIVIYIIGEVKQEGVYELNEISSEVGFTYPRYFSSTFKQMKGMTPKQFREENRMK